MAEPIIEQIAQWVALALGEVTVENGYQQTLLVSRPESHFMEEREVRDLTAIVVQGEQSLDQPGRHGMEDAFWLQIFEVYVFLFGAAGTGLAMDQRANRVAADVQNRFGMELVPATMRANNGQVANGLGYRIDLLPVSIAVHEQSNATLVMVPVGVAFETLVTNPYLQS
jgi:hypothetical protein